MDDHPTQLSAYGSILLMGIIGMLLVCVTIFLAKLISPKKPNPVKESTYECGEDPVGTAWTQFNPRFYVIALVFLLFDVELIFIFPWSVVFGSETLIASDGRWGWFTMMEMAIFLIILVVGLIYVWRRGDLNWIKPRHAVPTVSVNIPPKAYAQLNSRTYEIRNLGARNVSAGEMEKGIASQERASQSSLGFKPRFKKPGV